MKTTLALLLFIVGNAFGLELQLEPVVKKGIVQPIHVITAPGDKQKLFIVEQRGRILVLENGKLTPFLNIENKIISGGEMGLLSLAFHPKFAENHRYFLNYTVNKPRLQTVVVERNTQNDVEKVLLRIDQPYQNHNGGLNAFGPDGFLYIGMGDGGSAGDPHNNSQNPKSLLGKMLRIDVDHASGGVPYAIPSDNPALGADARREIYATGLRNPWRFSWDKETKALWVGDVGQNLLEEVNIVEKGGNYGWNVMEASLCFSPPKNCPTKGLTLPVWEYPRSEGVSITGGFVYRGEAIPELKGTYVFGDYQSGKIWGLKYDLSSKKVVSHELLSESELMISTFGEDANGELLVVDHRGGVYRAGK